MSTTDVIRFDCDQCGKTLKVPSSKAGKRGACPGCKSPIVVPKPETYDLKDNWLDSLPPATPSVPKQSAATLDRQRGSARGSRPREKSALLAAIKADWIGTGLISIPPFCVVFAGFLRVLPNEEVTRRGRTALTHDISETIFYAGLVSAVILIPLGILRILRSWRLVSIGVDVPWKIAEVMDRDDDTLTVKVQYSYKGRSYKKKMYIDHDADRKGHRLTINPRRPKSVLMQPPK